MSLELTALMFMLFNATPQMQVWIIDAYVEREITWQYFKHPRNQELVLQQKLGDCTDKAMLKCSIMQSRNISCKLVHGWVWSGTKWEKHDTYKYDVGKGWVQGDSFTRIIGEGVW